MRAGGRGSGGSDLSEESVAPGHRQPPPAGTGGSAAGRRGHGRACPSSPVPAVCGHHPRPPGRQAPSVGRRVRVKCPYWTVLLTTNLKTGLRAGAWGDDKAEALLSVGTAGLRGCWDTRGLRQQVLVAHTRCVCSAFRGWLASQFPCDLPTSPSAAMSEFGGRRPRPRAAVVHPAL